MILKYGQGNIILDDNKSAEIIVMKYQGNPYLQAATDVVISRSRDTIVFAGRNMQGQFCKYFGHLKILRCSINNTKAKIKPININLPELIDLYPENISAKPEKLNITYTHYKRYKGNQYKQRSLRGPRAKGSGQSRGVY